MEQAVAFMMGTTAVIVGLSLILREKDWSVYMHQLRAQGRPAALMIGYLHLIIGTFIVGFHWQWKGLPLLLTLIGVKAILEGITYTLFPNWMLAMLKWYEPHHRTFLRVAGVITIIIGMLVLKEWWQLRQPDICFWQSCFDQAVNTTNY